VIDRRGMLRREMKLIGTYGLCYPNERPKSISSDSQRSFKRL
jgi:hypothetical protein